MLSKNWKDYRDILSDIRDLEKIKRKLLMGKITPKDFYIMHANFVLIKKIVSMINKDDVLNEHLNNNQEIKKKLDTYIKLLEKTFDLNKAKFIDDLSSERLSNHSIDNLQFINRNLDETLDKQYKDSIECRQKFESIRAYLSGLVSKHEKGDKTSDYIKIHETPKMDPNLMGTKRRITFLKKGIENEIDLLNTLSSVKLEYNSNYSKQDEDFIFSINDLEYNTHGNSSNQIITNKDIRGISRLIQNSKDRLVNEIIIFFNKFATDFDKDLDDIIDLVIFMDMLQCKCYIADKYNYVKPIIEESQSAYVKAHGLRHCLIEHLNEQELYVTNDIELGLDKTGMLLYGTNAVGKTSLMKALGISVIMAQAGLFVPCSQFIYNPYTALFTRILGVDNIFKGLSTFAVEMSELRTIFHLADENSLVLGDELCSGTESNSALSIFMSGLEKLSNLKVNFIFATHFHEILKYNELAILDNVGIYHMTVIYNKEQDKLIYDRKLKQGPGDCMYGLEVCKALYMPDDFLNRANELRIKYNPEQTNILAFTRSHYNAKKVKGVCEYCNKEIGTEIHHINEQNRANIRNYIDGFHKNHIANLANICEKCHKKIHSNEDLKFI